MTQTKSFNPLFSYISKYTIIPIIPLFFLAIYSFNPENLFLDKTDHFYFEIISVILSFIIASYAILRGYAFNDKFTLIIGLGFHAGGFIDVLHAVISFLSPEQMLSTTNFMAQTWIAGRIVMGTVILIAILKFGSHKIIEQEDTITRHVVVLYVLSLSCFAIAIAIISSSVSFPFLDVAFEPNRPYEIPAAIIFALGLFYFYKKKLYMIDDNFYKGMLVALAVDISGNIIFTFSSVDFDTAFNFAHILKNVSLLIIIISLASSIIQHYKNKAQLATELKKIDQKKDEFSVMITHELKTPLTPIKGWCYALTHQDILGKLNDKQQNAIITIERNTSRLENLIQNILSAQKLEMNEEKFKMVNTSTKKILEAIKNNFEFMIQEKNMNFTCVTKDIIMKTDEIRIIQVLSNLIQNAIDFTIANVSIEVKAKEEGDFVIFSVKDNGIGISQENQKSLFKKFYQVDTSLTRKGGTGLGLTICKGIAEGLGGKIWVQSEEGTGSTFYFSIPIKKG